MRRVPQKQQHRLPKVLRSIALASAVLAAAPLLPIPSLVSVAQAADTLRPEVGKPLQAAQELMKAQKFKEALGKINEADAVPNKTPYENFIVQRMRGAAASGAGDTDTAAKAFEAVIASGKLSNDEQLQIMQSMTGTYYRAKDYPKAIVWAQKYQKAGGTDPNVAQLIIPSYYLSGDYASAAKAAQDQVNSEEKAGKKPSEEELQLLADSYHKQGNSAGYADSLEKLVAYYPKQDYWASLLVSVQRKPGFSDRLQLDVYRLMLATGNLKDASDYMEMTQLSLQAGYPKEAQKVMAAGFAAKALGTGSDIDRQNRLKALVDKQEADDQKTLNAPLNAAADGDSMVNTGFNLVLNAQYDKGIAMIQQGIAKGNLKHPDEAKLHLGEAYLMAGKVDDAMKTFKAVQGTDGTQDMAKLWSLRGKS